MWWVKTVIITQRQCALFSLFHPPMTCHPLWNRRRNRLVKIGDYKGKFRERQNNCCQSAATWIGTQRHGGFLRRRPSRNVTRQRRGQAQKRCPCCQNCLCMEKIITKRLFLRAYCNSKWYMPLFELAKNTFKDEIRDYYCGLTFTETLIKHGTKATKMILAKKKWKNGGIKKITLKSFPKKHFARHERNRYR